MLFLVNFKNRTVEKRKLPQVSNGRAFGFGTGVVARAVKNFYKDELS